MLTREERDRAERHIVEADKKFEDYHNASIPLPCEAEVLLAQARRLLFHADEAGAEITRLRHEQADMCQACCCAEGGAMKARDEEIKRLRDALGRECVARCGKDAYGQDMLICSKCNIGDAFAAGRKG